MKKDVEKIINQVDATMRLEGKPLTNEDKEMLRKCLKKESTYEIERQKIFDEIKRLNR